MSYDWEVPVVPKTRSSSFDASTLHQGEMSDVDASVSMLKVPSPDQWSGSEYSASDREGSSSLLLRVDIPKCFRRRSLEIPKLCIHCVHLEALSSQDSSVCSSPASAKLKAEGVGDHMFLYQSMSGDSEDEDDEYDDEDESFDDNVTLRLQNKSNQLSTSEKIASACPYGINTSVFTTPTSKVPYDLSNDPHIKKGVTDVDESNSHSRLTSMDSEKGSSESNPSLGSTEVIEPITELAWKEIVTLQVPLYKPRSSSLDATFTMPIHQAPDDRRNSCEYLIVSDPMKQQRSTSVDVSLPTDDTTNYRAITHYSPESTK